MSGARSQQQLQRHHYNRLSLKKVCCEARALGTNDAMTGPRRRLDVGLAGPVFCSDLFLGSSLLTAAVVPSLCPPCDTMSRLQRTCLPIPGARLLP